jgi:hypothetical protein
MKAKKTITNYDINCFCYQVHKKKDKKLKQSSPGTELKTEIRERRRPLQKEIKSDCVKRCISRWQRKSQ